MRIGLISVLACANLLAAGAARGADGADWSLFASSGGITVFAKAPDIKQKQVWLRTEFDIPQKSVKRDLVSATELRYFSSIELDEMDCSRDRVKTLQSYYYALPNMAGGSQSQPEEAWSYPAPGSAQAAMLRLFCHPTLDDNRQRSVLGLAGASAIDDPAVLAAMKNFDRGASSR